MTKKINLTEAERNPEEVVMRTIGLPAKVWELLKEEAAKEERPLNKQLSRILREHFGLLESKGVKK